MEQRKGPRPPIQMGMGIGIDLGSAYARVVDFDGFHFGCSAIPSYVAFTDLGVLVGEAAKKQATENPTNTIFDVIRLIGRRYADPSVQNDMKLWPFKVRAGPHDRLLINVCWKNKLWHFTPVEICSMILMQIKENAEMKLGATIIDAVITVPVHFNYEQRQEIRQAGMIAGLNFLRIISAPAASALFYGMKSLSKRSRTFTEVLLWPILGSKPEEHNMIIIDVGAGTVDVALVTVKEGMCKVRATAGNIHLGGLDFDNTMVDHFIDLIKRTKHTDISNNPRALSDLRALCEQAKIDLSFGADIVPMMTGMGPLYNNVEIELSISAAEFNELNKALVLKCVDIIDTCIRDVKNGADMVHEVILAGGSTRILLLQSYIQRCFEGKEFNVSEHLETATAYGAAFQAFICSLTENRRVQGLSLLDVTPFSLGIKTLPEKMTVFIPKHTPIPTKKEMMFTSENTKILVEVYEGESGVTTENNLLGKFEISGTSLSPNGCNFNIGFEIHENGTLTVTGVEISCGMRNGITISNKNMEDSRKRVWEALFYHQTQNGTNKASTTKGINCKSDRIKDKKMKSPLLSMGQSTNQYIEPEEYAIGIDFGTTNSSVAVWHRNCVRIIENEYSSRLTCSAVAFTDTDRLIGDTVHKEQVTTSPANTIPNVKRLIGKCFSDQSVQNDRKFLPFRILGDDQNRSIVLVQYKNEERLFAPEEIAAMILSKMKEIAEAYLSSKVTNAVVSVPACFSDSQRKAIKDAGVIAGLNVMQLLNEPTAAAIAYFSQKVSAKSSSEKTLLIFDLGGGNLDVSIVTINKGTIRVRAVVGDTNLGGEDFDNNMVCHFVEKFIKEKKREISNKQRSLRRLRAACEKAKRVLSTNAKTVVEIDALDDGIDFRSTITREDFEKLNMSLFKRSIGCIERCFEEAKMNRGCIDEVILVGGSTRIPKIQQLLQEFFNGKICKSMNADEAVVYGAAVQAAILSSNENCKKFNIFKLQDITSQSFGLESKDGAITNVLIPKHTPIPAKKELLLTTCSDNLSNFLIEVQECELASLTVFNISGITPKPRGKSNFCVSVEVDDSGMLNLTAKDISMREKNEKLAISKENGGLTTEEIHKMIEAAACYKAQDEEHKARAAALNSLENFAYKMKAIARDPFSSMPASGKKWVEEAADQVIAWLDTNHHAGIDEINAWKKHLEIIQGKVTPIV